MARLGQLLRSATSSRRSSYCPDTGDIIEINFDPQAGREQAGKRPALVLSPRRYNELVQLCILCPMTNQAKGYSYEVPVPGEVEMGGGVVLADQVKSLSWDMRGAEFKAKAPREVVVQVMAKLRTLLP